MSKVAKMIAAMGSIFEFGVQNVSQVGRHPLAKTRGLKRPSRMSIDGSISLM